MPVGRAALQAVASYLDIARPRLVKNRRESALFVNTRGSRLTRQAVWKIMKGHAQKCGITRPISPHTCGIPSPPTSCRTAQIFVLFKRCWGMQTFLLHRFIHT